MIQSKDIGKQIVYTDGRIWSKYSKDWITSHSTWKGYRRLKVNGRKQYVHRVIAEAFIPNPLNLPEVDHINEIKTDNRVENLRWVTTSQNMIAYFSRRKALNKSEQNCQDAR